MNMAEQEQITEEEQKKRKLEEKLKMLRLNSPQRDRATLKATQFKQRFRFTKGGKTKRS
jgi:hypothetical protein